MENFRKFRNGILCLSIGTLSMVSCIKDAAVTPQGVADVIIQDIKNRCGC